MSKPVLGRLPEVMRKLTTEEVGAALVHYVLESEHQGWDGHKPSDLPAYRRLFEDLAIVMESEKFSPVFFGGVHYATLNDYMNYDGKGK